MIYECHSLNYILKFIHANDQTDTFKITFSLNDFLDSDFGLYYLLFFVIEA